jgi:hypothetical protein
MTLTKDVVLTREGRGVPTPPSAESTSSTSGEVEDLLERRDAPDIAERGVWVLKQEREGQKRVKWMLGLNSLIV